MIRKVILSLYLLILAVGCNNANQYEIIYRNTQSVSTLSDEQSQLCKQVARLADTVEQTRRAITEDSKRNLFDNRRDAFTAVDCAMCGITFGLDDLFVARRRRDGYLFFCPNGHANTYRRATCR